MKKYLVEFNNGFESDENTLTNAFATLEDAKEYAKQNNDVYYLISEGEYDECCEGFGKGILTNCDNSSISWFYSKSAEYCEVSAL